MNAGTWRLGLVGLCTLFATCTQGLAFAGEPPNKPVEEVVIRGQAWSPPPKDPSTAGSVVRAERLQSPGLAASDILRTQPGLSVWSTGGHGSLSTAAIRGATSAQTPVYLAGVRMNDDVGGTADLSLIPLWMIHRVEIYRSHAPIQADALGIGGAIFFEPRSPKQSEASAGAMTGSFGTHGLFAHAATGKRQAAALLGVRYDSSENNYPYRDDRETRFNAADDVDAVRKNADCRTFDVWTLGTASLGSHGRVNLLFHGVERSQGMPGSGFATTSQARASFRRHIGSLGSTVPCAADGSCELQLRTTAILSGSAYRDPLREAMLGTASMDVGALRLEHAALLRLQVRDTLSLVPSVRVSTEHLAVQSLGQATARSQRSFLRAAASAAWQALPSTTLHATASAECHGTRARGQAPWALPGDVEAAAPSVCTSLQPSARLGVEAGRSPFTFLLSLGSYGRVPTLAELYGISGVVRGNAGLAAERGIVLDTGLRAQPFAHAYVEAFVFARRAESLIAYKRSSTGYVVPYNVGAARIAGAELVLGYNPFSFLVLECNATALDARDTSASRLVTRNILPYHSRLVVYPRIEIRGRLPVSWAQTGKISASYYRQSSRYSDPANLVSIPAQSSLDIEGELAFFGGSAVLRARISNALDSDRMDLVGYPLPRRALYTSVEVHY